MAIQRIGEILPSVWPKSEEQLGVNPHGWIESQVQMISELGTAGAMRKFMADMVIGPDRNNGYVYQCLSACPNRLELVAQLYSALDPLADGGFIGQFKQEVLRQIRPFGKDLLPVNPELWVKYVLRVLRDIESGEGLTELLLDLVRGHVAQALADDQRCPRPYEMGERLRRAIEAVPNDAHPFAAKVKAEIKQELRIRFPGLELD